MDLPEFHQALSRWYQLNRRDLSFRQSRNPYAIWLSEVMLQQTTVDVVIPYFDRFLAKYPTVSHLASARENDILTMWQGLGYYSRARNLHQSAKIIIKENAGKYPVKYDDWLKLPGIGPYTAAAIASIAYNEKVAVLDGNVIRVLARLLNIRDNVCATKTLSYLRGKAQELLNQDHPGDHNQAMMELGAVVCMKKPLCDTCPVNAFCQSRKDHPEKLPIKDKIKYKQVEYHLYLFFDRTHLVMEMPHNKSLVKGMWQLPGKYNGDHPVFAAVKKKPPVATVNHAITNKRIKAHIYTHPLIPLKRSHYKLVRRELLASLPLGTLARKAIDAVFTK